MSKASYITQPGTSAAAVVTASSSIEVTGATVCGAGGASTLTVYLVKSGDTAAADTMLYNAMSVGGGQTMTLNSLWNLYLGPGDAIHMLANDAATLTVALWTRDA